MSSHYFLEVAGEQCLLSSIITNYKTVIFCNRPWRADDTENDTKTTQLSWQNLTYIITHGKRLNKHFSFAPLSASKLISKEIWRASQNNFRRKKTTNC